MCLDFNVTANTHSASAIASTEKENFPFAHVRVKRRRTPIVCPCSCLTKILIVTKQLLNTDLTSRGGKRFIFLINGSQKKKPSVLFQTAYIFFTKQ